MTGPTPCSNEEQPAKQLCDTVFSLPILPNELNKENPFVVLRAIIIFMLPIQGILYKSVK